MSPSELPAPRRSLRAHVQKRRFIDESEEEIDSDDYIDSDEDNRRRSDDGREKEEEEEDGGSGYESGEDVERGEWDWGERVPRPSASDHAHKMWLQQHSTKIAAKCDELAQRGLSKVTRVLYAPGLVRWEVNDCSGCSLWWKRKRTATHYISLMSSDLSMLNRSFATNITVATI